MDKTDVIQVVGVQAEIVTAKSSEMNVLVPTDSGHFVSLLFIQVVVVCCVWDDNYFIIHGITKICDAYLMPDMHVP